MRKTRADHLQITDESQEVKVHQTGARAIERVLRKSKRKMLGAKELLVEKARGINDHANYDAKDNDFKKG